MNSGLNVFKVSYKKSKMARTSKCLSPSKMSHISLTYSRHTEAIIYIFQAEPAQEDFQLADTLIMFGHV